MESSKNTNIFIGIFVVVVIVVVFIAVSGGSSGTVSSGLVVGSSGSSSATVSAFLRKVSAIRSVKFDTAVFEHPVLKLGLKDQSKPLFEEGSGRTNPFSPFSGQRVVVRTSSSSVGDSQSSQSSQDIIEALVETPKPTKILSD